jgi:hypothetical protein
MSWVKAREGKTNLTADTDSGCHREQDMSPGLHFGTSTRVLSRRFFVVLIKRSFFITLGFFALFVVFFLVPQLAEERQFRNKYGMIRLGSTRAAVQDILGKAPGYLAMARDPQMLDDEILKHELWGGKLSTEAYFGKAYAIEIYLDQKDRVIGKTLVALTPNSPVNQIARAVGRCCGFLLKREPPVDSQEKWQWDRMVRTVW